MPRNKTSPDAVDSEAPADAPSSPEPTQEPAPAQPPENAGPVVAAATSDDRFVLGSWGGLPQYNCSRCPWDTVASIDAFNAHWEQHAPPPPPPPPAPPPLIFGPDGKPITSEV